MTRGRDDKKKRQPTRQQAPERKPIRQPDQTALNRLLALLSGGRRDER